MPKVLRITLIVVIALCIVLGVAIASVGTQLDHVRIDRDDLQTEVHDLRTESDGLRTERDTLKHQVDDQLKTIEQLKGELQQSHAPSSTTTTTAP